MFCSLRTKHFLVNKLTNLLFNKWFPITEKLRTDTLFPQSFICNQLNGYKEIYWIHINLFGDSTTARFFILSTICVIFN